MAVKWLAELDKYYPDLAERARHLNTRDNFQMWCQENDMNKSTHKNNRYIEDHQDSKRNPENNDMPPHRMRIQYEDFDKHTRVRSREDSSDVRDDELEQERYYKTNGKVQDEYGKPYLRVQNGYCKPYVKVRDDDSIESYNKNSDSYYSRANTIVDHSSRSRGSRSSSRHRRWKRSREGSDRMFVDSRERVKRQRVRDYFDP